MVDVYKVILGLCLNLKKGACLRTECVEFSRESFKSQYDTRAQSILHNPADKGTFLS